jgi:hypothetical protein
MWPVSTSPAVRCSSFDDVLRVMDALGPESRRAGPWSLPQALAHCAQSIEFSLTGFPQVRAAWFRATVGRVAASVFLRRGYLGHDLSALIPGAPALDERLTQEAGRALLREAIARFRAHKGPLAPHFAYGNVSRDDYEKLHAMHAADHLGAVSP